MKNITGIYAIRNIINNKVYVGSSKNIKNRWRNHRCQLNKRISHSPHLQNAWNKYGKENFIFSILAICEEKDLIFNEELWIHTLKSLNPEFGYNAFLPSTYGTKLFRKRTPSNKQHVAKERGIHCKDIVCINMLTKEVCIKNSFIIEQELNIKSKLYDLLSYWKENSKSKNKSSKGWLFIRSNEYDLHFDYVNYKRPRKVIKQKEKKEKEKVEKIIKPYSERNIKRTEIIAIKVSDLSETKFSSITLCVKTLNLKPNKVFDIIQKNSLTRTHRGYYFKKC
jgi:group I intron endonuclease